MQTFTDLVVTAILYVLLTISTLGWGRGVTLLTQVRNIGPSYLLVTIWLGWCGVIALLEITHLFLPLTIYTSAVIYGTGILIFVLSLPVRSAQLRRRLSLKMNDVVLPVILVFAIYVILRGMDSPQDCDSGLYHFNSIRWINEYAVVPGLGNLHDRLAFNYSYFPFVASLNMYPYFNHGYNIALGWLLLLLAWECSSALFRLRRSLHNRMELGYSDLLPALMLPYILYLGCATDLSSPQPNRCSLLIRLVIFIYFWRNLTATDKTQIIQTTKLILILTVTAVTLKLTNVVIGGTVSLIVLVRCFMAEESSFPLLLRNLGTTTLVCLIVVLPWVACGSITSGYPLFPSTLLALNVDWKVNPESAKRLTAWIYSWARLPNVDPDLVLRDESWFEPWLSRVWQSEPTEVVVPIESFILFSVLAIGSTLRSGIKLIRYPDLYLALLPVMSGLVFWFCTAPDIRYAEGMFWLLFLAVLCPYAANIVSPAQRQKAFAFALAVMCLPLLLNAKLEIFRLLNVSQTGWQPIPTAQLTEKFTNRGVGIYVPVAANDQGWNSPLPGTPYFSPDLELRGVGLGSGFKKRRGLQY